MTDIRKMLADLRQEYTQKELSESSIRKDPIEQFEVWFREALEAEVPEPNAMSLGTATTDGKPSVRIVLLKGFDEGGFTFFTNYDSRKGHELQANPHAALTFLWLPLERQVRIEGSIEKLSDEESDAYFLSRPRDSQIGAWTSPQSNVISSDELKERTKYFEEKFAGKDVERPPHWGGYLLKPGMLEFWQGRPSRLHDRIAYIRRGGQWHVSRLAP